MSESTKEKATVNPTAKEVVKDGLVYKPDDNKLVVTGILTGFRFSTSKYSQDKETYQVSIKTSALAPDVIKDIKERYFSDTKDKYLPSFIKDFEKDPGAKEVYINLKSMYEFGTFIDGEGNKRYSYDDVMDLGDGLAPLHSTVKLSMRLKEGSIYPLAVMILKLQKQDAADYFE